MHSQPEYCFKYDNLDQYHTLYTQVHTQQKNVTRFHAIIPYNYPLSTHNNVLKKRHFIDALVDYFYQ